MKLKSQIVNRDLNPQTQTSWYSEILIVHDYELYCLTCAEARSLTEDGTEHERTGPSDYIPRCSCCNARERDAADSLSTEGLVLGTESLLRALRGPDLAQPFDSQGRGPETLAEYLEDQADILEAGWRYVPTNQGPLCWMSPLEDPCRNLLRSLSVAVRTGDKTLIDTLVGSLTPLVTYAKDCLSLA